jgi:hypothetical protein
MRADPGLLPAAAVGWRRDKDPEEAALEAEVEGLRKRLEGMRELEPGEEDSIKVGAGLEQGGGGGRRGGA